MAVSGRLDYSSPAKDGQDITLDTTFTRQEGLARALWIGAAGNVSVRLASGNDLVIPNVPAGTMLSVMCTRVNTSGTTVSSPATNIKALF